MHKTIFMWFGNLSTSTELQGFHYYQGKIQSAATVFFSLLRNTTTTNPNYKIAFSTSYAQDSQWATKRAKFFFLGGVAPRPPRGLPISALAWADRPKPPLHRISLKKSPIKNYAILFGSGRVVKLDQIKRSSTKPNKSPTWRLVQSLTSTAILQKTQSFIPATHPLILKLEDQLKLRTASTSQ